MIYPFMLILHDKVLCFLYKLYKNEGFAWWFRLRLHIIAAIFCTLLVRLSCFQKKTVLYSLLYHSGHSEIQSRNSNLAATLPVDVNHS